MTLVLAVVNLILRPGKPPLCRFRQFKTISRGDGISPNLTENL